MKICFSPSRTANWLTGKPTDRAPGSHSSSEIKSASGRVAGVCSSTILKITVRGTARTMPTNPQSRLQNASPISPMGL